MRIASLFLLLVVASCTKASYKVTQPPAAAMLEQYKQIVVEKVGSTVWLDAHPRISQGPAYAQWRRCRRTG